MEEKDSQKIFITFDDGPNEPYTSQILDILKEFGAKASFFVCGKNVEYFPEITKRIVEEGHTIGNHTLSHSFLLTTFGFLKKEIEKTEEIILKVTKVKTKFFRPPWGILNPQLKKYLKEKNYKVVFWDINTYDWLRPSIKFIERRIFKKIKPNSIILFHDGGGSKIRVDRSKTVEILSLMIEKLNKEGYKLTSLEKL